MNHGIGKLSAPPQLFQLTPLTCCLHDPPLWPPNKAVWFVRKSRVKLLVEKKHWRYQSSDYKSCSWRWRVTCKIDIMGYMWPWTYRPANLHGATRYCCCLWSPSKSRCHMVCTGWPGNTMLNGGEHLMDGGSAPLKPIRGFGTSLNLGWSPSPWVIRHSL